MCVCNVDFLFTITQSAFLSFPLDYMKYQGHIAVIKAYYH
nr:MAG TPA: hypothetical protein [Caudoviricetes sp.]